MVILRIIFLISFIFCSAQNPYPQDYFSNPIKEKLLLSGTFAELRSNHFHGGLDIKTNGKEGLNVYTAARGYVSRIKISRYGYGKAIYITHPNGYTTVYAHLQKFTPKIEEYVKSKQYKNEKFEIQLFPNREELRISNNEIIAYSGNTGGSSGPHLHFEIRDNKERPINPMLFGIDIKDTTKPLLQGLYAYPLTKQSQINGKRLRQKIRLIKQADGNYKSEIIKAFGTIGFGVISNDRQDNANNKNGVSLIKTYLNEKKILEVDFKRFSFDESKHINRYIDYKYFSTNKKRIQKLFIQKNNPLSLFSFNENKGQIEVAQHNRAKYVVEILDFKKNKTSIEIQIVGEAPKQVSILKKSSNLTFINSSEPSSLSKGNFRVEIPKNTFYENTNINFDVKNDTLKLDKPIIPLQKAIDINFKVDHYPNEDIKFLFIGSVSNSGKLFYTMTKQKGNNLTSRTKKLGTYTIGIDKKGPKINPLNFKDKSWLSNTRYLKIKVSDDISGVNNYRATVNGKWILMEYDSKTSTLTHDFNDGIVTETENNLNLIATDNMGNNTKFECIFYRKLKN